MKLKLKSVMENEEVDERPIRFNPPEGNYRVVFIHFKPVEGKKSNKPKIRALWDILFPSDPRCIYRVWKDYPIEEGKVTKLESDLRKIFGDNLEEFYDKFGELDTDKLLGREADAKVVHEIKEGYKEPLVVVKALYAAGKFRLSAGSSDD